MDGSITYTEKYTQRKEQQSRIYRNQDTIENIDKIYKNKKAECSQVFIIKNKCTKTVANT